MDVLPTKYFEFYDCFRRYVNVKLAFTKPWTFKTTKSYLTYTASRARVGQSKPAPRSKGIAQGPSEAQF